MSQRLLEICMKCRNEPEGLAVRKGSKYLLGEPQAASEMGAVVRVSKRESAKDLKLLTSGA